MNWLLGSKAPDVQEPPETPVHRWALNAFKGALRPETPFPDHRSSHDAPAVVDNNNNNNNNASGFSILKTPGQARERRNTNVKFHKSVQTPPKRLTRSGLPNTFPGKFPSPWTPKSTEMTVDDSRDGEEVSASPIGIQKDVKANMGNNNNNNSLKKLSMQLESTRPVEKTDVKNSIRGREEAKKEKFDSSVRPLNWHVDEGFEEVLNSITKNNAYLQKLIDDMQESCSHVDESFAVEQSSGASDLTANLDEPRSRSGLYWKAKFAEFASLTDRLKSEQNNMEQALARLRADIGTRSTEENEHWKDRCDLLQEELVRERRSARNDPLNREVRELRKQVRDLQVTKEENKDLKQQVSIADAEIRDLQRQVKQAGQKKDESSLSERIKDAPSTSRSQPPDGRDSRLTIASVKVSSLASLPHSATSRRLALAQAAVAAERIPAQSTDDKEIRTDILPSAAISHAKTTQGRDRTIRTHGRFGSRTTNTILHQETVDVHSPGKTHGQTNPGEVAKALSGVNLPPNAEESRSALDPIPVNVRPPSADRIVVKESPRPAFARLADNGPAASSVITGTGDSAARRAAARQRLELFKAKRAADKSRTVPVSLRG